MQFGLEVFQQFRQRHSKAKCDDFKHRQTDGLSSTLHVTYETAVNTERHRHVGLAQVTTCAKLAQSYAEAIGDEPGTALLIPPFMHGRLGDCESMTGGPFSGCNG
jgi:hypothetical protein